MSAIPLARRMLANLAPDLAPEHAAVVQEAIRLMHRRPYAKPAAPRRSAPVGPDTAATIRAYVRAHPYLSEQEVARVFRTNPGRVSEALHGLR